MRLGIELSLRTTAADFRCATQADVAADAIVFERMRECGAVETASSEEKPELVPLGGSGYSVRPVYVAAGP